MSYCRTARKGTIADFFSIIAFMLIILVFYFLFKFTLHKPVFTIEPQSSKSQDYISLFNILKTEIEYQNSKISIAELISLSQTSKENYALLDKELAKLMDKVFDISGCHMMCINGNKIKSSGCKTLEIYKCSNAIAVPGMDSKPIGVSFQSNIEQPKLRQIPLK